VSAAANAIMLIRTFSKGLEEGHRYFHPKTGKQLVTVREILETMISAGSVDIQIPQGAVAP
jgi:hypothetical protein